MPSVSVVLEAPLLSVVAYLVSDKAKLVKTS